LQGVPMASPGLASLTRFNPGNAHAWGLSRHEELVGSGELDGDQTTQGNTGFTQVQPPW
jgi:hypothetical protein